MIEKPKNSRSQLDYHRFEQKGTGNWFLNLLPYYAMLFEQLNPVIMKKSNTGWRDSESKKSQYAFFKGLTDEDIKVIWNFINVFSKRVIINVGKNINKDFSNELDYCIALDFTFEENNREKRTKTYEWVYQAKNKKSQKALESLAPQLTACINDIDKLVGTGSKCLSYIPVSDSKRIDLPRKLVDLIKDDLIQANIIRSEQPIIEASLNCDKKDLKDLKITSKVTEWKRIYEKNSVELNCSVSGATVYIIDDLYQSGATLWSYAKYLKSQGAVRTIGIVCSKTWKDSDNI